MPWFSSVKSSKMFAPVNCSATVLPSTISCESLSAGRRKKIRRVPTAETPSPSQHVAGHPASTRRPRPGSGCSTRSLPPSCRPADCAAGRASRTGPPRAPQRAESRSGNLPAGRPKSTMPRCRPFAPIGALPRIAPFFAVARRAVARLMCRDAIPQHRDDVVFQQIRAG